MRRINFFSNHLHKVTDAAADAAPGDYSKYNDIKQGQADDNYQYDEIGNLIKDNVEGITNVTWNVYGKIASLTKSGSLIKYVYDAAGNRIMKQTASDTTIYVRDASGNVMSVYSKPASGALVQSEMHLYGSSRIGMATLHPVADTSETLTGGFASGIKRIFTRGKKLFELSNHLGNVLVTVTDRKIAVSAGGSSIDYYKADISSANDYYPFGMQQPGRKFNAGNYRYGFNGKERDSETIGTSTYDYGFRIYNPGIGKFLSNDPLAKYYPWYSPYQFAGNSPLKFIDLDGLEPSNNPQTSGVKDKAAKATVVSIFYESTKNNLSQNLTSKGIWTAEQLAGAYSCSTEPLIKGGVTDESHNYVSDNTNINTAMTLNTYVSSKNIFYVDESNQSKFENYEAFVVNELMSNFVGGIGPENYDFPVNGVISSKFYESDIFKKALSEFNSGILKPNETKQYNFGVPDLARDALRNGTLFSITGFAGSGTITFIPSAEGINVKIFNVTSLASGALVKNPNDFSTYPKSYVRDPFKETEYGNISQTFNLFIPWESDLLNK